MTQVLTESPFDYRPDDEIRFSYSNLTGLCGNFRCKSTYPEELKDGKCPCCGWKKLKIVTKSTPKPLPKRKFVNI